MKPLPCVLVRAAVLVAVALSLGGCRSGPSLEDAEGMLRNGDSEAALEAARNAGQAERDPAGISRAKRVAFEANLRLGCTDAAARELAFLEPASSDRDRLLERLAGTTLLAALESPDAGRRAVAASEIALAAPHPKLPCLVDRALADLEPGVREAALPSVLRLADNGAVLERLCRLVADDPSPEVKRAARSLLAARIGGADARAGDTDELTQARRCLGAHPEDDGGSGPSTTPLPLGESFAGRVARADSSDFAPASVRAVFAAELTDPDYESRLLAVRMVGVQLRAGDGDRSTLGKRLVALLDDPTAPVREAAVEELGSLAEEWLRS